MSRFVHLAAAGFSLFIVATIVAANTGIDHAGGALVKWLPFGDKIGHVVLFGALAFIINLALGCRTIAIARCSFLLGSVGVSAFVVVEELSQAFIATRSLSAADLVADFVGIAAASVAAPRLHRLLIARGATA